MHASWEFKNPQGLIHKKDFPYDSRFLEGSDWTDAYYLGFTADIGMDPQEVGALLDKIMLALQDFNLRWTANNNAPIAKVEVLVNKLDLDWYSDALWLLGRNDDGELCAVIEPESDGTEVGVFFKKEIDYKNFLNTVQAN